LFYGDFNPQKNAKNQNFLKSGAKYLTKYGKKEYNNIKFMVSFGALAEY